MNHFPQYSYLCTIKNVNKEINHYMTEEEELGWQNYEKEERKLTEASGHEQKL